VYLIKLHPLLFYYELYVPVLRVWLYYFTQFPHLRTTCETDPWLLGTIGFIGTTNAYARILFLSSTDIILSPLSCKHFRAHSELDAN